MILKILHVSGARSWGGNEQQLIDLICELNLKAVNNVVFGIKNSPVEKECNNRNIPFVSSRTKKLSQFKNLLHLKGIIEQQNPDVIHLHSSDSLTLFCLSDLIYKIKKPCVFSKKGMGRSSSFLSKFKYNYKNISAIICVSKKVETEFSDFLNHKQREKLKVIYDGISISRIEEAKEPIFNMLNVSAAKFNLLHIGNHVPAKSLPTLIEMMNVLVNQMKQNEVKLIQIGEFKNEITGILKQMIQRYKLENHVHLAGFVDKASSYINQFDVFVMSSEREGFPLTIYEAFYEKVAVVSTKAGGIPEILSDNKNGFIVETGDYHSLAVKVNELLLKPEKRNQFAKNAYHSFIENYTAAQCAKQTLEVYKQIIL